MNRPLLINAKSYPNNFDVIRFILASSVILCHSYVILYGYKIFRKTEPFMKWSHQQISIGSFAVNFFFIISGFLIARSLQNSHSLSDYLKKRVLRIYPGFLVALGICYVIAGFIGSGQPFSVAGYKAYLTFLTIKHEIVHLVTLQWPYERIFFKPNPEPGLNDSVWTIQFEFGCYLLLPLLAGLGMFRKKWIAIALFIFTYIVQVLQAKGILPFFNPGFLLIANPYHYPRFISYFLGGVLVYLYRDKIIQSHWLAFACLAAIVISFGWTNSVDAVLPLAGTYLLFYLAFHPSIRLWHFARYGDFSYGIYLYGWPVQAVIAYYFRSQLTPFSFFISSWVIAGILAVLSWHLVEKPFLKMKNKLKKVPAEAAGAVA